MSDGFEWGPWVEHDGKGCPLPRGVSSEAMCRDGEIRRGTVGRLDHGSNSAWAWAGKWMCFKDVIRYRIRRPRAVEDLARLAADPYAPPPVIGPDSPVRQPEDVPA
jgi:hypothetical protein